MGEGKREEAAAGSGSVAVSGASPEAAAPAPPRKAGRPAAYTYNRIRGLFLLALIGLLGFGLFLLRDAPELTKSVIVGPNGETILVVIEKVEKGGGRGWPFDPEVHLILSRVPVDFDPLRSVIEPRDGAPQVVARTWSTVLVDSRGRPEAWPLELEPEEAEGLSRAGFEEARAHLSLRAPGLAAFWSR